MFGSFSSEHLERYAQLAAEKAGVNFAEGDYYDFRRCVRPNGTSYGTRGQCRKGTESEAKKEETNKKGMTKKDVDKIFEGFMNDLRRDMEYEQDAKIPDEDWKEYTYHSRRRKGKDEMIVTVSNEEGGGQYIVARVDRKTGEKEYLGIDSEYVYDDD
jgi:hypothetical protein